MIQVLRSTLPSNPMCLLGRLEPGFRDEPIGAAFLQSFGALAHRRRAPERLVRGARLRAHLRTARRPW